MPTIFSFVTLIKAHVLESREKKFVGCNLLIIRCVFYIYKYHPPPVLNTDGM
jgi:hypothetical protein